MKIQKDNMFVGIFQPQTNFAKLFCIPKHSNIVSSPIYFQGLLYIYRIEINYIIQKIFLFVNKWTNICAQQTHNDYNRTSHKIQIYAGIGHHGGSGHNRAGRERTDTQGRASRCAPSCHREGRASFPCHARRGDRSGHPEFPLRTLVGGYRRGVIRSRKS